MARGIPKDPQKRQAQIERGKKLGKLHKKQMQDQVIQLQPTEKQKQVVTKFIKNGFKRVDAVMDTYNVKKRKNAAVIARQIFKKPHVKQELKIQLQTAGLGIDDLTDYAKRIIEYNMQGKPSQAVASSMVQFGFKLNDSLPTTKKMTMSMSVSDQLPSKDVGDLKKTLEELQRTSQALISHLEGKK